jgi:hypothetical protein
MRSLLRAALEGDLGMPEGEGGDDRELIELKGPLSEVFSQALNQDYARPDVAAPGEPRLKPWCTPMGEGCIPRSRRSRKTGSPDKPTAGTVGSTARKPMPISMRIQLLTRYICAEASHGEDHRGRVRRGLSRARD